MVQNKPHPYGEAPLPSIVDAAVCPYAAYIYISVLIYLCQEYIKPARLFFRTIFRTVVTHSSRPIRAATVRSSMGGRGTKHCRRHHNMGSGAIANQVYSRSSYWVPYVVGGRQHQPPPLFLLAYAAYLLESEGTQFETGTPMTVSRSSKTPVSVLMRVSEAML
jgi:hypothetical protein